MKNKSISTILILLIIVMSFVLTGCIHKPEPPIVDGTPLTVSPEIVNIYTYQSQKLSANLQGVSWSSSDETIARVDSSTGIVTGISEGIVTITATKGEQTAACRVTVVDDYSMPVLELGNRYVAVNQNSDYTVSANVTVRGEKLSNVVYSWTVVDGQEAVSVHIDGDGSNALIKGLSYGSALIKVEAMVDNYTLTNFIEVDVKNVTVWFDVSNVIRSEDVYKVNLYALTDEELANDVTPIINVYNCESKIEDASFLWSSENDGVATVSADGLIRAVAPGTTFIYAAYGTDIVIFQVNVLYAQKAVAERIDIELGRNEGDMALPTVSIAIPEDITEAVESVKIGNSEVLHSKTDTALVIDKSKLPVEMGHYTLSIQTKNAVYTAEGVICTMAIYTPEDLDKFGAVAKRMSEQQFTWDGYFVLGNDIVYNDTSSDESTWREYQSFMGISILNKDGGDPWDYSNNVGFKGVFDGCGYNIDGFMTSAEYPNDRGGFIGILNIDGVIKDLSFTNAVHKGLGGFLTSLAGGRIDNVFIHASKHYIINDETPASSWYNGFLVGCDSKYMLDINNCIVMVDELIGAQKDFAYASTLGTFWMNNGSLSNVYAIGGMNKAVSTLYYSGYAPLGIKDIYGSYANVSDYLMADIKTDGFNAEFWNLESGIPIPWTATKYIQDDLFLNVPSTSLLKGESITIKTNDFTAIDIDEASKKLGITLQNNVLSVPDIDDIEVGHVITLTARSVLDNTDIKTIQIKVSGEINDLVLDAIEFDMYHLNQGGAVELNGSFVELDLSAYESSIFDGNIHATIGGNTFTSARYDASTGMLFLDKASVGTLYGEQTIYVTFKKTDAAGDVISYTQLTIPTSVYSMIIRDKADLDAFGAVAKIYGDGTFTWDGYFVLGNNIAYNDTTKDDSTWTEYQSFTGVSILNKDGGDAWGYAENVGFKGIFDGCGYNIDGFMTSITWPNERGGFIGILNANGVIKNLSFTNAVHKGLGGFLTTMAGGRIENIFIHARKQYITQDKYYPGSYKNGFLVGYDSKYMLDINNCVVIVDECISTDESDKDYASTLGAFWMDNGSLNNVFAIGGMNKAVISMNYSGYPSLGIPDIYGSYADEAAFKAAGIDLSSFDRSFWDISSGVPVSVSGREFIK